MPYGVFHPGPGKKQRPKLGKNLGNTFDGKVVTKPGLPLKGGQKPKR